MKEIIKLDALVAMRDMNVRARSPATWSASCWEKKYILIHCLVKKRAIIPFFSLNVSFCRMASPKVNHDVIWRSMMSQERALRFIYSDYSSSYESLLIKSQLPSLKVRRLRTIALE